LPEDHGVGNNHLECVSRFDVIRGTV